MAQVETNELQALILNLARQFGVDRSLIRVEIEPDLIDESDGTLRITLRVKNLEKANLSDLQKLVGAVEDSLSERDDRFPSVRFAEAA